MADDDKPRGFWQSLPGILTAAAAVITAVAGLVTVMRSGGIGSSRPPTSVTTPGLPTVRVPPPGPAQPRIHSEGRLVVRGTWLCDLDEGAETNSGGSADFFWEQVNGVTRYLAPRNNAQFAVIGIRDFPSLLYAELRDLRFSSEKIDASNLPSNRLPKGAVVAYRTKTGRLGKFEVEDYGYNLSIRWATYETR